MVIASATLLDILTLRNKQVRAMALWPLIIIREKSYSRDAVVMNHERIHHRQQLELLIIPYYIWYFLEYWTAMFTNGFRHHKAYMSISFEQEAYANEKNLEYLQHRKWLSSWRFFKTKFKRHDRSKKD